MGTSIAGLRDEIKSAKEEAQKASREADKTEKTLKAEIDSLTKTMQDMRKAGGDSSSRALAEIEALKAKMAEREEDVRKDKLAAQEKHSKQLEAVGEKHRAELEAQAAVKQKEIAALQQSLRDLVAEMAAARADFERQTNLLSSTTTAAMEQAAAAHAEEVSQLKLNLAAMENQLANMADSTESDKFALRTKVTDLEAKSRALQADIDSKKKEYERSETITTGSFSFPPSQGLSPLCRRV